MVRKSLHRICLLLVCWLLAFAQEAKAQCIDFYALDSAWVKCEIGPYNARTGQSAWTTQKVDEGPGESASRHTVHRNPLKVDAITTGNGTITGLREVPDGELASVRLGNWLDGHDVKCLYNRCNGADLTGEAERITYTFTVTEENKYILLRYAIVWENPGGHNDLLPSFQIETLTGAFDETPINDLCYSFNMTVGNAMIDHVCNSTLNHRVCNGSSGTRLTTETHDVAWRDWRTRIINLEDYLGQTVRLRLTSSDCGHKGHFGYSYYTLRCLDVNLYSPTCGGPTETRTFTAPEGLNYVWYKVADDPAHTRQELLTETSNRLTVLNDGQMYECYIASPENANCHISLYAKAEPRVPMSEFEVNKTEACVDTIMLTDHSCVSSDGVSPLVPHENVSQVIWDLGDGRVTSADQTGVKITYAQDGTYTIRQTTRLITGTDTCTNVKAIPVTVRGRETRHEGTEYDTICAGQSKTWFGQEYNRTGVYSYTIENGAANHYCDSVVRLHLKVWDAYHWNNTIDVLEGREIPYVWHRNGAPKNLYTSGVYWDSCQTVHGCDSVYKLVMRVRPNHFFLEKDTICEGESYAYHKNGVTVHYTQEGVYYDSLLTRTYGNDSVYCLQLTVLPSPHYTETRNFCQGDTVEFHGQRFWTDGPHTVSFTSPRGCDSTFTLILHRLPTYLRDTNVTVTNLQLPYTFGSQLCTGQGVYIDSLHSAAGCDSVVRLHLTVLPVYFHNDLPATICQGEKYNFHDTLLTTAGTYQRRYKSVYGTDSVYQIVLTVNPRYEQTIYRTICEGEYVIFAGESRTHGGIYSDSLLTHLGCDSITRLNLTVNPKIRVHEDVHLCEGDYFNFKGTHITRGGIYADTVPSGLTGCDSIHSYHVYVHPVLRDTTRAAICQGESYLFHGNTFTAAGTHEVVGQSIYGCDSTYVLMLTVNPVYHRDTTLILCHGDNLSLFGRLYTAGGEYHDTLKSVNGCDSIYSIHIREYGKWLNARSYALCQGDSYIWRGQTITSAGVYYDSLVSTVSGCDSVYQLTVNMRNTYHTVLSETILSIGYYDFNGTVLRDAGTYTRHFVSERNGCDSLVELQLTVLPVYNIDTAAVICQGETFVWNGLQPTTTGTYQVTLQSVYGTDSVVRLALTVYQPIVHELPVVHISDQESYTWHGTTYTASGTYEHHDVSNVTGCDSITRLRLVVHPTYHFPVENVTICANQFFTWDKNHSSYNTAGEYVYNPKTVWGYDSVYTLRLSVGSTYMQSLTAHICEGETYNFFGRPLSEGGLYRDTLPTTSGTCDSIFLLTLIEHPVHYSTRTQTICLGDSYTWEPWPGHRRTLSTAGVYLDTIRSAQYGCDSIRYTLHLSTRKPFYEEMVASTCDNHPYTWRGHSYNRTGIYYDSLHSVLMPFCDSVYCLKLQVFPTYEYTLYDTICEGEKREFGGIYYGEGGYYTRTLTSSRGCDSIIHLSLTVKPISRIERHVELCDGEVFRFHGADYTTSGTYIDTTLSTLVGCDSITTFRVQFHPVQRDTLYAETCGGEGFVFYGQTFYTTGEHVLGGQSAYGCDSLHVLRLTVHPSYQKDTTVTLCSGDQLSVLGKVYTAGGLYYDTLHTINGCDSVYSIRINEYSHTYEHMDISLCKGDFYDWRGRRITAAGIYRDTVFHPSGCNDVYELAVTLRIPGYREIETSISGASYYDLNGRILRSTGVYYDTLPNASANGCDSIVQLTLTVYPEYKNKQTARICEGESYPFTDHYGLLTESGFYSDTLTSVLGTDSIVELVLTVYSPIVHDQVVHISDRESYTWQGTTYTASGTYERHALSSVTGCDSIDRLKLFVHPTYLYETYVEMCDTARLNWRKYNGLIESGTYYDSLLTQTWNYDSIYVLHLTVNPAYRHDTTVHICTGDGYEFGGEVLYNGGYYRDTLTTTGGCDSIFNLMLIKHPVYRHEERKTICQGDYFDWRGQRLTDGNIYEDIRPEAHGCDSTFRLYLDVHPTFYQELHVDLCEGEYYDFHGRQLNRTGVYWDSLFTRTHHCDSVYRLELTVHRSVRVERYDTICGTEYTMFGGRPLYTGGTYIDSLQTAFGCDSIIILHLMHYPVEFKRTVRDVCRGETVSWTYDGGQPVTLSVAGVYPDTLVSRVSGCDSIVELRLSVYNTYYHEQSESFCANESYNFHGRLLNQPGTYWDSLTTVQTGCDSVYRLDLKVNPSYEQEETVYLCDWQNYYFAGERITRSGTYYDRLTTRQGCDSVFTLHAYVSPSRKDSIVERMCLGETYSFHGTPLTADGIYRDTLNDPMTRQCVISVVNLSFAAQSVILRVDVEDACADDESFVLRNSYIGARPVSYSLLFDERSHAAGFEDIIDQPYAERIYAPIPQRDSTGYIRPDYYHATLVVDNSVCVPDSQSVMAVELLLRYPSWIIEQNWNDVVAVLNEHYNGGYVFSDYQWYINGNETGIKTPYIYMPQTLAIGDEVVVAPTRAGEDYAVPSCPIVIYDMTPELVSEFPVLCGAMEMPGRFYIRSAAAGSYTLYSPLGRLMDSGAYRPGDYLEVQTQTAAGCYLLRLTTDTYGTRTVKLILR
ncbi:MAG: PKD domain-containing protein [Paludibacteraceae bacterium]|nr:PKD domain-containing protein [Paludibacteraceae bacterium]